MNQEIIEFGWWIEIITANPTCVYYFGAFTYPWEAEWFKRGYMQDLEEEKAEIVSIKVRRCQPQSLTIYLGWEKLRENILAN